MVYIIYYILYVTYCVLYMIEYILYIIYLSATRILPNPLRRIGGLEGRCVLGLFWESSGVL